MADSATLGGFCNFIKQRVSTLRRGNNFPFDVRKDGGREKTKCGQLPAYSYPQIYVP